NNAWVTIQYKIHHGPIFVSGGELDDKEAPEIESKGKTMGYEPGALLFGGGDQLLMCIPDLDESKIRKLSHSLAYTSIKLTILQDEVEKLRKSLEKDGEVTSLIENEEAINIQAHQGTFLILFPFSQTRIDKKYYTATRYTLHSCTALCYFAPCTGVFTSYLVYLDTKHVSISIHMYARWIDINFSLDSILIYLKHIN
ncbi:hypothetical protein ACJX0J_016042, partial [Zea mays]